MTYLAGSVSSLVTDRNTWHSRADQAWGSSRVWNTGSSFETDLASMTADRNNWQSSSNTWQGRANQAWGTSRVWNSGESWEAAYNRVLPYAGPYDLNVSIPNCPDNNNSLVLVWQGSVPIPGYWDVTFRGNYTGFASNAQGQWALRINGSNADTSSVGSCPSGVTIGAYWRGVLATSDLVQWYAGRASQGYSSNINGTLHIVFIPTPSYPH